MSVAPEHYRAARFALPRLPLPAILGFAVTGFGGALFLAYTGFSSPETTHSLASVSAAPVYEARAVPLDPSPEDAATRATAIARALTATQTGAQRAQTGDADREFEQTESELLTGADGELRGFNRFANSGVANSYLALTGTAFGSTHMAPSGVFASDAETVTFAPVPEVSTWLCGAALLALVVARGLHASWHRHQRRSGSKSDSAGGSR